MNDPLTDKWKQWLGNKFEGSMRFIIGLILGFCLCLLVHEDFFLGSSQRSLSVTFPGGSEITLDAVQDAMSFDSLYSLISMGPYRHALIEELASDHIYHIEDLRLVDTLNAHLCEPIPEEPLEEKTSAGEKCAKLPVAKRLRELADMHITPFHYVGRVVQIGTPAGNELPLGRANACKESELRGRTVQIIDIQSERDIKVTATGYYECTGYSKKYPDIQIGDRDAINLFGRPTDEYEKAVAVILP